MDIAIIVFFILVGVFLLWMELFLLPGVTIAAIGSVGCFGYANYYAFFYLGASEGFITLLITAICIITSIVWLMRSKTLDKIALKENISSKIDRTAEDTIKVGDVGVSVTRLNPMGNVLFNGHLVEVKTMGGYVEENLEVIVLAIENGHIIVGEKA